MFAVSIRQGRYAESTPYVQFTLVSLARWSPFPSLSITSYCQSAAAARSLNVSCRKIYRSLHSFQHAADDGQYQGKVHRYDVGVEPRPGFSKLL